MTPAAMVDRARQPGLLRQSLRPPPRIAFNVLAPFVAAVANARYFVLQVEDQPGQPHQHRAHPGCAG